MPISRILFLDVDGVLNPDKHPDNNSFDATCVENLKKIIASNPQLRIVISSTWKTGFSLFCLGYIWRHHDLPLAIVIGKTPDIRNARKSQEITKWLEDASLHLPKNGNISRFAVLDDDPAEVGAPVDSKSVFLCNPREGLTAHLAEAIIQHLK